MCQSYRGPNKGAHKCADDKVPDPLSYGLAHDEEPYGGSGYKDADELTNRIAHDEAPYEGSDYEDADKAAYEGSDKGTDDIYGASDDSRTNARAIVCCANRLAFYKGTSWSTTARGN